MKYMATRDDESDVDEAIGEIALRRQGLRDQALGGGCLADHRAHDRG
jgi:hypothetical protein